MKPDPEENAATPDGSPRRRVRLFVALHLGAVGTIYAVAVVIGGGLAGPPLPPPTVATARPQATATPQHPPLASPVAAQVRPTPLPEWTSRAEIAAPWESR